MISAVEEANLRSCQEDLDVLALRESSAATASGRAACAAERDALIARRTKTIAELRSGPPFWPLVLASHPAVGALLSTQDAPYVSCLRHIESEALPNGYRLRFSFADGKGFDAVEVCKDFCTDAKVGATVGTCSFPWRRGHFGGAFFSWLQGNDDVFGLGDVIRKKLLPQAVDYYFGTASASDHALDEHEIESLDDFQQTPRSGFKVT